MTPTLATEVGFRPEVTPVPLPAASQVEPFSLATLPRLPRGPERKVDLCRQNSASSPFPGTGTPIPADGSPSAPGPPRPAAQAQRRPQIWPQQDPNSSPPPPSSLLPFPGLSHLLEVLGGSALLLALLGCSLGSISLSTAHFKPGPP